MICHNCQTTNLAGTLFCSACGVSLMPDARRHDTTMALGQSRSAVVRRAPDGTTPLPERRFCATVLNSGRTINMPLGSVLLMGRQDAAREFTPDIDLNPDGGYEGGVSRRHARIVLRHSDAYIEDLESANGTFVNNERLRPRTPHKLHPSDELKLGSMILRIDRA